MGANFSADAPDVANDLLVSVVMSTADDFAALIETIRRQREDLQRRIADGGATDPTTSKRLEGLEELRARADETGRVRLLRG